MTLFALCFFDYLLSLKSLGKGNRHPRPPPFLTLVRWSFAQTPSRSINPPKAFALLLVVLFGDVSVMFPRAGDQLANSQSDGIKIFDLRESVPSSPIHPPSFHNSQNPSRSLIVTPREFSEKVLMDGRERERESSSSGRTSDRIWRWLSLKKYSTLHLSTSSPLFLFYSIHPTAENLPNGNWKRTFLIWHRLFRNDKSTGNKSESRFHWASIFGWSYWKLP